jgi:secondary thiamine-phosphate synthase enzyme
VQTRLIRIDTGDRLVTDITAEVREFCAPHGDGLCSVFAPHATAGLGLMELGSGSEADLARAVENLLPRSQSYRHRHGSPGHGADHLLPVFISPSILLPVIGGSPALGTWQSLVLVDPNVDNPVRNVRLSFIESA